MSRWSTASSPVPGDVEHLYVRPPPGDGIVQSAAGRLTHIGATAELDTIGDEVVQIVKVMTGLIHVRFVDQPELLVEWDSASSVVAAPRSGEKPDTGEVRPAA